MTFHSSSEPQAPIKNAVLELRQQRLSQSTRPFLARGCRVIRCNNCLLPQTHCLCDLIVPQVAKSLFCLLMYDTEPLKPSNTGRLIADILPDTHAFQWSRTEVDERLVALLADTAYQAYVVFPASYADPERVVTAPISSTDKIPLFILLDGTWTEARKMFRKSPYLASLPVISVDVDKKSRYLLREASREEQHCTVEVAVRLLEQAQDHQAASELAAHFERFRRHYLFAKYNHKLIDGVDLPIRKN